MSTLTTLPTKVPGELIEYPDYPENEEFPPKKNSISFPAKLMENAAKKVAADIERKVLGIKPGFRELFGVVIRVEHMKSTPPETWATVRRNSGGDDVYIKVAADSPPLLLGDAVYITDKGEVTKNSDPPGHKWTPLPIKKWPYRIYVNGEQLFRYSDYLDFKIPEGKVIEEFSRLPGPKKLEAGLVVRLKLAHYDRVHHMIGVNSEFEFDIKPGFVLVKSGFIRRFEPHSLEVRPRSNYFTATVQFAWDGDEPELIETGLDY